MLTIKGLTISIYCMAINANHRYIPRLADKVLDDILKMRGAVLIEGIKWCGKTTTAKQIAKSLIDLSNQKEKDRVSFLLSEQPDKLFRSKKPILMDEWQKVPLLWDAIRSEVDKESEFGQFILTGSTSQLEAAKTVNAHSGIGRIGRLKMQPMSLWESKDSNGDVSLTAVFDGDNIGYSESEKSIEDIAFLCARGGWPAVLDMPKRLALKQAYLYLDELCESDIQTIDGHRRSSSKMRKLLQSYARYSGSMAPTTSISNDLMELSRPTVIDYINALEKLFVISEIEAWNPNFRSSVAIQSSNTRYYTDPSIAVAALHMGPEDLMNDYETFGFIFETMVIRDLRSYAQILDADVFHYRDSSGRECDAVLHCRNGKYALIEVKLGQNQEDYAAANLLSLSEKLVKDGNRKPDFLMVITATGYVHRRNDGVLSVPVCCLRN